MDLNVFIGKDYDEILSEALKDLKLTEDDVIVSSKEVKKGLFKGKELELTITPLTDVASYIKEYIEKVLLKIDVGVKFETQIREKQIKIEMYTDDNSLIIGKNGNNLAALQTVVRQVVKNRYNTIPYISLDVENYKNKQILYLQKTARRIAREVSNTRVAVELDNMNAYERLIIHQIVADFDTVYSESVGVEPNRHVVIKPKE